MILRFPVTQKLSESDRPLEQHNPSECCLSLDAKSPEFRRQPVIQRAVREPRSLCHHQVRTLRATGSVCLDLAGPAELRVRAAGRWSMWGPCGRSQQSPRQSSAFQ